MKGTSEARLAAALRTMELDPAPFVLRVPDARSPTQLTNWKPCDYVVWFVARRASESAWIEVKDVDAVDAFPFAELRQSQRLGILSAKRLGVPYWLAIWWSRHKRWTISDGVRVLDWQRANTDKTSISRGLLQSRFGIESNNAQLSSTLKAVLLGEVT